MGRGSRTGSSPSTTTRRRARRRFGLCRILGDAPMYLERSVRYFPKYPVGLADQGFWPIDVGEGPPPNDLGVYSPVRDRAAKTWSLRWKTDIEIDGPVEDQQAVRSFLF